MYGITYYCVLSKKGYSQVIKISAVVRRDFYVVIICISGVDVRPINSLLPVHTHPHKGSRQGQNNHNTLFYGKWDSSEILLVGKYCEGCNPVAESDL